jgi:hypothetical protein
MGRDWVGPINSLRDAYRARVLLWFFCLSCGHNGRFSPYELAKLAKRDMTFDEIKPHLRCTRCKKLGNAEIFPSDQMMPEPMKR